MKKLLTLFGIAAASLAYAQGGTFILNNYTPYQYRGTILAANTLSCYPVVGNADHIWVPPNSHTGNGQQLQYDNYRDQYNNSLYPTPNWSVSTAVNSNNIRPWNHGSLVPGGTISTNTKWAGSKFEMYDLATSSYVTGFSVSLIITSCNPAMITPHFTSPNGVNSAEMFIIGNVTYLQLY